MNTSFPVRDPRHAPRKYPRKNGRAMKRKGDDFERELARFLNAALGLRSFRAPLSGGGNPFPRAPNTEAFRIPQDPMFAPGADILGVPGLHIEAKRVEILNFPTALKQAEAAILKSGSTDAPVVINRRNRQHIAEAYVFLRLKDFLPLLAAHLKERGVPNDDPQSDPAPGPGLGQS